jgi:citrate lyase subunit beta / citryl-CoA lyase
VTTAHPAPRLRRSVLYVPGANERAIEKARTLPADVVILDLEDAVLPDAKAAARTAVVAAITAGGFRAAEVVIRINGMDTPWGRADLAAAGNSPADAILLPKVRTPADVGAAEAVLVTGGFKRRPHLARHAVVRRASIKPLYTARRPRGLEHLDSR